MPKQRRLPLRSHAASAGAVSHTLTSSSTTSAHTVVSNFLHNLCTYTYAPGDRFTKHLRKNLKFII